MTDIGNVNETCSRSAKEFPKKTNIGIADKCKVFGEIGKRGFEIVTISGFFSTIYMSTTRVQNPK